LLLRAFLRPRYSGYEYVDYKAIAHPRLLQIVAEEQSQFIKGNEIDTIVKIHVTGTRNNEHFLWLSCQLLRLFTELSGMGIINSDEKHRARRNRLDLSERVKIRAHPAENVKAIF
jgi:hypothetical protein